MADNQQRQSIFDSALHEIAQRRREINITENNGCQRCGNTVGCIRYHQRTMYHYDGAPGDENDPNMVTLCSECKEENDAYWDERWDDYYSGCL